jgi:hypothetical protein
MAVPLAQQRYRHRGGLLQHTPQYTAFLRIEVCKTINEIRKSNY